MAALTRTVNAGACRGKNLAREVASQQAPAVSANEGTRHCGQAAFNSKPNGSCATRASTSRAS